LENKYQLFIARKYKASVKQTCVEKRLFFQWGEKDLVTCCLLKSDNRMKAVCVRYLIIMIGHCPLAFKQCKIKNKKSKQKHFFFFRQHCITACWAFSW